MTEREKMLRGEQFETLDPQLSEDRRRAAALLSRLNALSMDASGYREALGELLPHASDECLIRPPFYCDYGYSLFIGRGVFINFNCVMLDGAPIRIGDHVLIGPRSVVGAGSVVIRDVEPDVVVAGNPARVVRRLR